MFVKIDASSDINLNKSENVPSVTQVDLTESTVDDPVNLIQVTQIS